MNKSDTTEDILYFDAFTEIGPRREKHPHHPWRLEELIDEMEHCSVSGALVACTQSVYYDPHFGNLELSQMLESRDDLFPIWNVMPSHTGEIPDPRELRELLGAHGVGAVTFYPKTNAWDWDEDYSRELLEMLGATRTLSGCALRQGLRDRGHGDRNDTEASQRLRGDHADPGPDGDH